MTIWDQVQELMESVNEAEMDIYAHVEYVVELSANLDPNNVEEEITEKQILYVGWLYEGYRNENWMSWVEWLEENGYEEKDFPVKEKLTRHGA